MSDPWTFVRENWPVSVQWVGEEGVDGTTSSSPPFPSSSASPSLVSAVDSDSGAVASKRDADDAGVADGSATPDISRDLVQEEGSVVDLERGSLVRNRGRITTAHRDCALFRLVWRVGPNSPQPKEARPYGESVIMIPPMFLLVFFSAILLAMITNFAANQRRYIVPENGTKVDDAGHNIFDGVFRPPTVFPDMMPWVGLLVTAFYIMKMDDAFVVFRRQMLMWSFVMIIRAVCVASTVFPDPSGNRCASRGRFRFFDTCGDLMFSGHAVTITLNTLAWMRYGKFTYQKVLAWMYAFASFLLIVASRLHYTADIVVAVIVVVAVYGTYHAILDVPELRSRHAWWIDFFEEPPSFARRKAAMSDIEDGEDEGDVLQPLRSSSNSSQ